MMLPMMQRVYRILVPDWARPADAFFRYVHQQQTAKRGVLLRWLRWTGGLAILAAMVSISYAAAQNGEPLMMGAPTNWLIYDVLYAPLVVIQGLAVLGALLSMNGAIATEQTRRTWEAITITSHGAERVIRARWVALLYQMRWILALLIGARLTFTGLLLVDLATSEFDYLAAYTSGITPGIAPEVGGLLLAVWMAAALLQSAVMVGFNAAFGLLIAVVVRNRIARGLAYMIVALFEWGIWGWFMVGGLWLLDGDPAELALEHVSAAGHWLQLLGMGVLGDQGLRFLHLDSTLQTWPDVSYGALIGVAWLAAIFVQVLITDRLLIMAGRLAARPRQE